MEPRAVLLHPDPALIPSCFNQVWGGGKMRKIFDRTRVRMAVCSIHTPLSSLTISTYQHLNKN